MSRQSREAARERLIESLARHSELGHPKRDDAFVRQVALEAEAGTATPSEAAAGREADQHSLYRFLSNSKIDLGDLRQSRRETLLDALPKGSTLLNVHDLTQLDYTRHDSKQDRRLIGNHLNQGYEYSTILAVDPQSGQVLGTVHDTLISAQGPDDCQEMDYDYEPRLRDLSPEDKKRLYDNHGHQMCVHIHGLASELKDYHIVDVADMEYDDLFVLAAELANDHDYVIRCKGARNVQVQPLPWMGEGVWTDKQWGHDTPEGWRCAQLEQLVLQLPLQDYKRVGLDSQGRVVHGQQKIWRWAQLGIGSLRVRLYRPAQRNGQLYKLPEALETNVVVIREPNPPEGVEPLCWILLTSLDVSSFEQMALVGHYYELRWKTEPYYRLLKSGYRIEKLRLETAEQIARWLIVVSLAAMVILGLKAKLGLPEQGYLDEEQYQRVKQASKHLNDPSYDAPMRLFALMAKQGGWLGRRRDPIGPLTLMRGWLKVVGALELLRECAPLLEQVRGDPEILDWLLSR